MPAHRPTPDHDVGTDCALYMMDRVEGTERHASVKPSEMKHWRSFCAANDDAFASAP
jgi:hypothetical protein